MTLTLTRNWIIYILCIAWLLLDRRQLIQSFHDLQLKEFVRRMAGTDCNSDPKTLSLFELERRRERTTKVALYCARLTGLKNHTQPCRHVDEICPTPLQQHAHFFEMGRWNSVQVAAHVHITVSRTAIAHYRLHTCLDLASSCKISEEKRYRDPVDRPAWHIKCACEQV